MQIDKIKINGIDRGFPTIIPSNTEINLDTNIAHGGTYTPTTDGWITIKGYPNVSNHEAGLGFIAGKLNWCYRSGWSSTVQCSTSMPVKKGQEITIVRYMSTVTDFHFVPTINSNLKKIKSFTINNKQYIISSMTPDVNNYETAYREGNSYTRTAPYSGYYSLREYANSGSTYDLGCAGFKNSDSELQFYLRPGKNSNSWVGTSIPAFKGTRIHNSNYNQTVLECNFIYTETGKSDNVIQSISFNDSKYNFRIGAPEKTKYIELDTSLRKFTAPSDGWYTYNAWVTDGSNGFDKSIGFLNHSNNMSFFQKPGINSSNNIGSSILVKKNDDIELGLTSNSIHVNQIRFIPCVGTAD